MTQDATLPTPVSPQDAGVIAFARPLDFPPTARVRTKREYALVFDSGRRVAEPLMALHWQKATTTARLGLAVSRKVDPHAVGRNRIKRVLRDAFRQLRPEIAPGAYVVVARTAAAKADNAALRASFIRLLQRAAALPQAARVGTMPPAPSLPFDGSAPSRLAESGKPVR